MPDNLVDMVPFVTAIAAAISGLLLLLALVQFRRSRRDVFWRRRRDAGRRGLRLLLLAILGFVASGMMCLVSALLIMIEDNEASDDKVDPTQAAVLPETPTPIMLPTDTVVTAAGASPTTPVPVELSPTILTPTDTPASTPTAGTTPPDARATTPVADAAVPTVPTQPPESTPTPVATATETPTDLPSATPSPAQSATPPPTQPPETVIVVVTATPAVTPSATPLPTFTPEGGAAAASRVTPHPDAWLRVTALDDQISDTFAPVDPRRTFANGTPRLYFFVEFGNMAPGVQWQWSLLLNGEVIETNMHLWGVEESGETFFFVGPVGGFVAGRYELRLALGERAVPAASYTFSVSS